MARETLSERFLRENAAVFEAMVSHRFTTDIERGLLPAEAFDRYLVYEGAFVDTAISIFALATAKAGTIKQKRWLIGVLDALANRQVAYFERTFAQRGIKPERFDLAAAMFAAEWMYWTWSRRVAAAPIADPLLREWVAMHADDAFAAQARWLRDQIDAADGGLDEATRARLSGVFGRVQELEIAFHEAAYGPVGEAAA